ncbi:MAG: glycosyltransferase [Candidatus Beckwithbacteria bacterium]
MISVIIPCKKKADLCPELLPSLKNQTCQNFEILIVDDQICSGSPAEKRDLGAKKAQGEILGFIDSDAYPDKNWLKLASQQLESNSKLAAVCGPGLTPPTDSKTQKLSGQIWSSYFGAGSLAFRNRQAKPRLVDDYPSFNLFVKQPDFQAVSGFNTKFWPGEDTKLCHDLVFKLKKQILYQPNILVYHHRRPILKDHLQQISRYGFQRGRFVKLFPKTSLKLIYFLPLLFPFYLPILILAGLYYRSLTLPIIIILTHLTYACFFIKGLVTRVEPL